MTQHYSFLTNDGVGRHIDEMVRIGLWGDTPELVIEGLVMFGIRDAITHGTLFAQEELSEEFAAPARPPPGPVILGGPPKLLYPLNEAGRCATCDGGRDLSKIPNGAIECPACGLDFIPF